jgi:hypothetical protein
METEPDSGAGQRSPRGLRERLRDAYDEHADESERALLLSWAAFGVTFGAARVITHVLRRRDASSGGAGGIVVAGRHVHHYNAGILALVAVGGIAVHGQEARRRHPVLSCSYGAGVALVVDELALLLDLSDVYWANDGRVSVDAAIGTIAVGGAALAATSFWGAAAREISRPGMR